MRLLKYNLLFNFLFAIGIFFLSSVFSPSPANAEIVRSEIIAIDEADSASLLRASSEQGTALQVTVKTLSGRNPGEEFTFPHFIHGHRVYDYLPVIGDKVIVSIDAVSGILTREYALTTGCFLILPLILFLVMNRLYGLRAFLGILASIVLMYSVLFQLLRHGYHIYIFGTLITFVMVGLTGWLAFPQKRRIATTLGILGGLLVVMLASHIFFSMTHISGIRTDIGKTLYSMPHIMLDNIDLTTILLLGNIIAITGILVDIGALLSSVLEEIRQHRPNVAPRELRQYGIYLGKEVFPQLFNTLLLSYAGISLPFLALIYFLKIPLLKVLNYQFIGLEIISIVAAGLGMMAAIYTISFALTTPFRITRITARPETIFILLVLAIVITSGPNEAFEFPEESELRVHPLLDCVPAKTDFFPARIMTVTAGSRDTQNIQLESLAGRYQGQQFPALNFLSGNEHLDIKIEPGSLILARRNRAGGDNAGSVFVDDYLRIVPLSIIVFGFTLLYIAFCRRTAIGGLCSIIVIVAICYCWLPYTLVTYNSLTLVPRLLAALILVTVLIFLFQYGPTKKNLIALVATLSALFFSFILASLFLMTQHLEGFSSVSFRLMAYLNLTRHGNPAFNYQIITIAGIIIYSLGVIIDATVDAVSGLDKIKQAMPVRKKRWLSFAPIRTIAIAMGGTLVFVSLGTHLMEFFLCSITYEKQTILLLNDPTLNLESGRIICGSTVFLLALLFSYLYFHLFAWNTKKRQQRLHR